MLSGCSQWSLHRTRDSTGLAIRVGCWTQGTSGKVLVQMRSSLCKTAPVAETMHASNKPAPRLTATSASWTLWTPIATPGMETWPGLHAGSARAARTKAVPSDMEQISTRPGGSSRSGRSRRRTSGACRRSARSGSRCFGSSTLQETWMDLTYPVPRAPAGTYCPAHSCKRRLGG